MREQTTLNQSPKFSAANLTGATGLVLLSAVCLLLATLCTVSTPIVSLIFSGDLFDTSLIDLLNDLATTFAASARRLICGLLLPVSLLLLASNTQKDSLAKIFMIVAGVFVVVQLLGAVLMAFFALLTYDSELPKLFQPISAMLSYVDGSRVLAYPVYFLQFLIRGHFSFLSFVRTLFTYTLQSISCLLLILSNVVCGLGFMKMAMVKKEN